VRRIELMWLAPMLAATVMVQTAQADRSGVGPCRQGVLGLIAKLDAGEQTMPDFKQVARDVVETCGATTVHPSGPAEIDQASCRQQAVSMLDTIEDGKMRTRAFTRTKTAFARTCAPR
jgi:hypothetical protein